MNNRQNMVNALSEKLGVDKSTVNDAVNSGSTEKLLAALNPEDAEKLSRILSDEEATRRIMQSEKVQKLMRKLSGK